MFQIGRGDIWNYVAIDAGQVAIIVNGLSMEISKEMKQHGLLDARNTQMQNISNWLAQIQVVRILIVIGELKPRV